MPDATSSHHHALPMVDISPFVNPTSDTSARDRTVETLRQALHTYGFFYLTNHSLSQERTDRIVSLARTFFSTATPEQKAQIQRRSAGDGLGDGARGYQKIGENITYGHRDWHEAIDWYTPIAAGEGAESSSGPHDVRDATGLEGGSAKATRQPPFGLLEGVNFWPREPAGFREAYEEYVVECRKLGEAVLRAMGDALRLQDPDHFVKAVKDSFWVMRAIGYPPLDDALAKTGGVSCGEHSDYGCLTLLLDDGTPGALQVFRRGEREGEGSWVNAEPVKGALVVNVGEMVEKWTGGEVRSTKHRVVHTGKSFRVSVPFFLEPGRDVIVECLDEFKDGLKTRIERGEATADDHKPIRYWDHLVGKVGGNFVETET